MHFTLLEAALSITRKGKHWVASADGQHEGTDNKKSSGPSFSFQKLNFIKRTFKE